MGDGIWSWPEFGEFEGRQNFVSHAGGKKGPDGASKRPLKTSQAPGTHSLLLEASSHVVSNIRNALTCDIQYDLVCTTSEHDLFFFPPLATLYIMWDLFFFFNINYWFFNWRIIALQNCVGLCHTLVACGILVPWSGIWPAPPAVEAWSPNHWITRKSQAGSL